MNKIYRIIWNSTLGQWVVTSELGRGKIKRATNKKLAAIGLGLSLVSTSALATPTCDSLFNCSVATDWSYGIANSGAETLVVSDGNSYNVTGPSSFDGNTSAGIISMKIDEAIAQGYITNNTMTINDKPLIALGSKNNTIVVTDPSSGVTSTVSMYNSDAITQSLRVNTVSVIDVSQGSAPYYYQAGFVKVTDGEATINVAAPTISGSFKDTQLAAAISSTNDAKVVWASNNRVSQGASVASAETATTNVSYHVYANTITAFDGSTKVINDLAGLKAYNTWLGEQIVSGNLSGGSYDSELSKAYTLKYANYVVNPLPANGTVSDPILTADMGTFAPLYASGSKATAVLTGSLIGTVAYNSNHIHSLMLIENGATGINQGRIASWGFGYGSTIVKTGGTFINQGVVDNNNSAGTTYLSMTHGAGSHYINDTTGVINFSPAGTYTIDSGYAVMVYEGGRFTNKGTVNLTNIDRATPGRVYGVHVVSNSSVDNQGTITLGITPDGTAVNASADSAIINFNETTAASTNSGKLIIGEKVEGASAIRVAPSSGTVLNFDNSGTIDILGQKSETAASNIGINVLSKKTGIVNSGTINVKGTNNIGIKVTTQGHVSSTGDINVVGKQTSNNLNNFGVWVEGTGSAVDVSGAVNLSGDNAIAVHVKDQGQLDLSGNGRVTFTDGVNQIGYYIYGTGSKINNTSSGTQDVTTANSTLMRLDGGASFTGSAAATSTMGASGENATVIVATGTGTSVDSGGMTVNVNGKNATGFLIEGGAAGTIGSTATINLSGEGAIAGIADGQGHTLAGAETVMTDAQKKATKLTAGANLNASLDGVVGYIARNLATITNSGNISFSGDNTTGIQVEEGAVGVNSGNIQLDGTGSVGLVASASSKATQLSSTGNIILNGDWDGADDASRSTGVLADGAQVNVTVGDGTNAAAVNLNGAGTVGVHAQGGSKVTLNDNVAVNFDSSKSDQIAFWIDGSGSQIVTNAGGTTTNVNGDGATLFYVTDSATLSGDLNLNLSGVAGSEKVTSGIRVSGAGSQATLTGGSQLTIGTNATGVLAENAGEAVIASGAAFSVSGTNAVVGKATGTDSSVENHAVVTSLAGSSGSTAFLAENDGTINNQGNIDLSLGSNHTAIDLNNGHVVNTGNIQANGTAIHIKGSNSTISNSGTISAVDGMAAIHVDAGAGLNLSAVSGSGTIIAKGTADGILLDTGALSLNVANTLIDMSDASASGIGIHNVAGIEGIKLDNTQIKVGGTGLGIKTGASLAQSNSGTIDVTDGTGILFINEDGSAVASNLDLNDSTELTLNVSGSGVGVKATLDGNNREMNTGVSVNVLSTSGGSAIDVTGAKSVSNSGSLISQSTVATGNVLNVHDADTISNSGTIAASSADVAAIAMSNSGNKTFTNSGDITGFMDFASGDNLIQLTGGTVTGAIKANGGANTVVASGGSVQTGDVNLAGNSANTVTVKEASSLGDVVMSGTANHVVSAVDGSTLASVTLGDGANEITLADSTVGAIAVGNGNNTLTLSGTAEADAVTAGTGTNTLTLTDSASIDSFSGAAGSENHITVKNSATFGTLDAGTGGAADSLTFDGVDYALAGTSDIQHFDVLNLTNGSVFTTDQTIQMGDTATSVGKMAIDGSSSLVLAPVSGYTLNHILSGNGLIDVQSGTAFDFGTDAGTQFAGNVQMNSTDFALSGFNTSALTNAILTVMGNNTTTVGSGTQNIGGLAFNGGTVDFCVSIPNAAVSPNQIAMNTLDASGTGSVQISAGGFDNGVAPMVNQTLGLLDQQTETLVQLASATTVTGEGGNLTLIDENGSAISNGTSAAIMQNGVNAAEATYDYRLTTKDNSGNANGLYVGYGLTELNLLSSGSDRLVLDTSHSREKVLSARITGDGDLGIAAGNGADALTLSNLNNNYTGQTQVQSGTLILGTDNALGETSELLIHTDTTVDINGKTQTIGYLSLDEGATVDLNQGRLHIAGGGNAHGNLAGFGEMTVGNGVLTVFKGNAGLAGRTTVGTGAEALLMDVQSLGDMTLMIDGIVTLDNASGTFVNSLYSQGLLNIHNGSVVRLSGDNRGFIGTMDIDTASTLTVSETDHVGETIGIQNANQLIVDNGSAMQIAAAVSGSGDLIKQNSGTLTLSGTNTYSGTTDIQSGIVAISADDNLGDGSATNLTVLNGGNLQITADLISARNITLNQSGSVIVDNGMTASMSGWDDRGVSTNAITKTGEGTLVWTGDNSANTADVNVAEGTLQIDTLDNLASQNGVVNLAANGILSIQKITAADADFTRQLSGSGELKVDLGDSAHSLTFNASAAGGSFSGQVTMDNGRFVLNSDADAAMGLATLALNGDGTRLGSTELTGTHTLGGLILNGGQLEVDYSSTDNRPLGFLTVNTLDVTGGGNLAITTPANLPNPMPVTGESLFDQDDGVYDQIVSATGVNGNGTQLAVTQVDGTPVAADTIIELIQGGVAAGNAHYNYFGAVKADGLYLGYGLTQLDAFAGQSVILDNGNADDNKLGAKLTGDGGFTVNATGTVHIGNATSDYTGATDINSGSVVMITDNALGQTSQLTMQSGTLLDLNGNSQTVGAMNTLSGSTLNVNNGELTVSNGGTSAGTLTGAGQLNLISGTLSVTENSAQFTGTTDIADGAIAQLTKPQGLGQGVIETNTGGTLNLDTAAGTLFNRLNGNGNVTLTNAANMWLGGDNSGFAGTFTTNSGTTLTASQAEHLGSATVSNDGTLVLDTSSLWALDNTINGSGTLVKRGAGTVQLDGSNVTVANTTIENGLLLVGGLPEGYGTNSAISALAASTSANLTSNVSIEANGALGGYGTVTGNVTNAGTLIMGNALTGAGEGEFTLDGNYHGNGGTVIFSTTLNGDSAKTDKLVITGNSTGESSVTVRNLYGTGEQTASNGIKLIDVGGSSSGIFKLNGRAVAGAYEYFLYQGGITTPDDGDWYLRSSLEGENPDPEIYRPEAGGYLSNMAAAGRLFSLRLEDREGRAENSSMWLRQVGSRLKHRDSTGQLKTATDSYVVQGGGEVFGVDTSDTGRFGLGIMAAYGRAESKSASRTTGYRANSQIEGYSTGLYGTWYQDAATLNGAYVDSWVQYSWLDAQVNGQGQGNESYDMDGFSASLETGYRLPVYEGANSNVFITPQAQVTWNGIKADEHREARGTTVKGSGEDNIQTRLGVKLAREGVSDADKGLDKLFGVYAEVNWLHNSEQAGAVMDGVEVKQGGSRHVGELKLGAEGQVNKNLNVWTNVGQQLGDNGYSETSVTLGIKYRF